MDWIKCENGKMPEDFEEYEGKKIIDVLVTTDSNKVTKVQRKKSNYGWRFTRVSAKAWMPLPAPYVEE